MHSFVPLRNDAQNTMQGCIQKFSDWVDNELNNKH